MGVNGQSDLPVPDGVLNFILLRGPSKAIDNSRAGGNPRPRPEDKPLTTVPTPSIFIRHPCGHPRFWRTRDEEEVGMVACGMHHTPPSSMPLSTQITTASHKEKRLLAPHRQTAGSSACLMGPWGDGKHLPGPDRRTRRSRRHYWERFNRCHTSTDAYHRPVDLNYVSYRSPPSISHPAGQETSCQSPATQRAELC